MQFSAAPAPPSDPRTFAGMLMDLATPPTRRPPARDLGGLEDDVATLSYEQAIRMHGRNRPSSSDSRPQLVPDAPPAPPALKRKTQSVTVRLSQTESERLRIRASESGLTVSDYLRSCLFEVESLRAQVKETVAALRALQTLTQQPSRPVWLRWLSSRRPQS